ncbi:hypothetical protein TrRE_jg4621 [Triparma retinervis]|uniref:Cation/H+ exchanger transmembrane domain-containing protein n=1 Tax=Triparma retinervis TaxID=2557542 RepID=A0A9W7E9M3_9STRA|nr:hypothetical protein TrRE_jg4621 [Triparma retinervis]
MISVVATTIFLLLSTALHNVNGLINPQYCLLSDQRLAVFCICLIVCLLTKHLLHTYRVTFLPAAGAYVLVGMLGGGLLSLAPHLRIQFSEKVFLRILLPPICFEGALSIDKRAFRSYIGPILSLAIVGTVLSSVITAAIMKAGGTLLKCTQAEDDDGTDDCNFPDGMPWTESMAFGALISSIDPVAVLAVLNDLGVSSTSPLYIMIFGESLLNDGVSIVLFDTVQGFFADDATVQADDVAKAIGTFLLVFLGSAAIGFVVGLLCNLTFRWTDGKMR